MAEDGGEAEDGGVDEDGEESEDDDEVEGVGFDVEPVSSDTSGLRLMQILNAHLRLLFNYVIYIL